MRGTTIRNRQFSYIGALPFEEEAMREIEASKRPSLYGFMPITPGKNEIAKNPNLNLYKNAGDIAYLTFTKDSARGALDKDVNMPRLDGRTRAKLVSYLASHQDDELAKTLENPGTDQFKELCKLYNSNPEKYGGKGGVDLREVIMRLQFVRDWELYLKLMSGKEGALGRSERENMFDTMRKNAEKIYKESNPKLYKDLLKLIDKTELETERFLSKESAGGLMVLMKSEWGQILDSIPIKDSSLRKAFYNLAIDATKKANWTAGKRKEAVLDKDGIKKFFDEINKNAPDEVRKSNKTAEKQLNKVLDKYRDEKDEEGFGKKTFAVLCSTVAIDAAANAFSIGLTVSDGDRIIYMNSNVTPQHGTDIKCAEMNMNGEVRNFIENIADADYADDRERYAEQVETEMQEIEEATAQYEEPQGQEEYQEEDPLLHDIFGGR